MKPSIKNMISIISLLSIVAIVFTTGCLQQDYSKELKPIIDRAVAVWNNGNVEEVDDIWAPGVIRNANQLPAVDGIEGMKAVITSFRTAYPDAELKIDEEIYSENKAILRWTFAGTNTGEGEMPPTGKGIKIWGMSILHFENGKLTREYVAYDNQSLMEQLGFTMMPPSDGK